MTENEKAVSRVKDALLLTLDEKSSEQPVVPIFGAGASISSGVPSGNYLMECMARNLIDGGLIRTEAFKEKLGDKAESAAEEIQKKPLELSFEGVLDMYGSIYGEDTLYEWLQSQIRDPHLTYFPSFTQEYCAHLVSGGFLKYFISFNFDEILENALEEELGHASFQVVASNSEFQRLSGKSRSEWDSEFIRHCPKCYVLKPHGTISRQRSLRHRSRDVRIFGPDKEPALREVLQGSLMLLLGFGHYNEDGWLLFGETYSAGLTDDIVVVDTNPDKIKKRLGNTSTRRIYYYRETTDQFFDDLAQELHKSPQLQKRQRPTRHQVRSLFFDLFSRHLSKMEDEDCYRSQTEGLRKISKGWFHERVYELELLIYLFKTRGLFVDLATAHCHRVKEALDRCLTAGAHQQQDRRVWSVLQNVLGENVASNSIRDRFDLNALNTRWCFLLLPGEQEFRLESDDATLVAKKSADAFAQWVSVQLPKDSLDTGRIGSTFRDKLAKYLSELSSSFDVDVSGEDRSIALRFEAPAILRNRHEFAEQTTQLLKFKHWNCLRVAAVAGEWLVKELEDAYPHGFVNHRDINIISNLDMFTNKPKGTDPELAQQGYSPLDLFHYRQMVRSIKRLLDYVDKAGNDICLTWYAFRNLEHHMTIASCKLNDGTEHFERGIYFWRAGKNTSVSPVLLNETADIREIAKYFDERVAQSTDWLIAKKPSGKVFVKRTGHAVTMPHDENYPVLQNLASALEKLRVNVERPRTTADEAA